MRRNYKLILLILLLAGVFFGFKRYQQQVAEDKEASILQRVNLVIDYAHYHPSEMDDKFSEAVYNKFLEDVDPSKRYLLQSDIDSLSKYKDQIDDELQVLNLDFYKNAYEIITKRQKEALTYIDEALDKPFDFTLKDTLNTDYKKRLYAKNKAELKDRWRKYLKLNTLSRVYEKLEAQKKKKDSADFKPKSLAEIEKEAREASAKSIKNFKDLLSEMEESDYFSIFMNAVVMQNDPHTNYFSPQGKERFDTSMAGSFDGIGARLQKEGDYVKIMEIIPGGPAWKQEKLKVGDLIQKVAQGDDEPVDIMGMRLDKVVKLIKGHRKTVVKLTVKRVDGTIKTIAITRGKVELEETFAKSLIIKHQGKNFGYIYLPKFYINFNDKNQRSAATDIKKELEKLKKSGVKGIMIDLRNNGGGSLSTVIDIAGFFIDKGPVVQVKDKHDDIEVLKDKDRSVVYDGSVVVLINELSASASEILAAALQDYNRAVIIGSKSYGKGTVQNLVDLSQVNVPGKDFGDLGALKWTTKKFYRINGGSTQIKGVQPDIELPDTYKYLDIREEDEPTALKWDQIQKADYKLHQIPHKVEIIQQEQARINSTPLFKNINKKAKWLADNRKDYKIYLNLDDYTKDLKKSENISKEFDSLTKYVSDLDVSSLTADLVGKKNDTIFKAKRSKWIKAIKKDPYIGEAVKVLEKMSK